LRDRGPLPRRRHPRRGVRRAACRRAAPLDPRPDRRHPLLHPRRAAVRHPRRARGRGRGGARRRAFPRARRDRLRRPGRGLLVGRAPRGRALDRAAPGRAGHDLGWHAVRRSRPQRRLGPPARRCRRRTDLGRRVRLRPRRDRPRRRDAGPRTLALGCRAAHAHHRRGGRRVHGPGGPAHAPGRPRRRDQRSTRPRRARRARREHTRARLSVASVIARAAMGGPDVRIERPEQLAALDFEKGGGLVPVVAQHAHTGEVLMLAYANREALERTLATGTMWYYSRTRDALWRKGETSGNTQRLVSLHADCDADAVLARVEPAGPSCHTGARSCFSAPPTIAALADVLAARRASPPAGSYTARLFGDRNLRLKKLGEEATELALACVMGETERVAEEAADLLYHALVACAAAAVEPAEVLAPPDRRLPGPVPEGEE